ncbi:hypothetical protein D1BOALGB6SA_8330 [Olavius sp. associated proteobacterium Delta 1]|nr:hypothetical protein D1BOALGB6SA_8330 [Olavius sp. associated proteobacterium Delta 1]
MKPLIVYQSRTGNTRIIVDTIASILKADVFQVENAGSDHFKGRTLVGFGSGIYWTMVDRKIYESASFLPPECKVFMFITSGMGSKFMLRLYWYFIKMKFDRFGLKLVGNWDCRGYDQHPISKWMGISKGRPNRTDIESAEQFALKMKMYE